MFPAAAVVASLTALVTAEVTGVLVVLLAVSLVPWAFLAGGVRVPDWMMTVGIVVPSVISILHCKTVGPEFNLLQRERRLVDQLERARNLLGDAAAAEERRRVAREIHDIVGHSLTVVLLNVAGARRLVRTDPDAATEALSQAEHLGRESLEQMREAVGLLRGDGSPDDDTNAGRAPLPTATDVRALVERSRRAGLDVDLHVDGALDSLDPGAGLSVFRVVQEALTNAGRHAHGAPVDVHIAAGTDRVHVQVRNRRPAVVAPASDRGTGLLGMRERVAAAGGTLAAGPAPDGGWLVDAELPTRAVASAPSR